MKVSAFFDVVCPWCYIGITRFERAAASYTLETGEPVEISMLAHQQHPDAPSNHRPLLEAMGESLGGRAHALEVAAVVAEAGRTDGLSFDFESAVEANSFDAHRLITWAGAAAGPGAQRDLTHELWRAHFAEGADVADHVTLASRAAAVGIDADDADALLASDGAAEEVRLQVATAVSIGFGPKDGPDTARAPTLVFAGKYAVAGPQPYETYVQVLKEVARTASES